MPSPTILFLNTPLNDFEPPTPSTIEAEENEFSNKA